MTIKQKTQKGFTLIELLMVVAIIAILSTMILITLDSGREKAELHRYTSYAVQMYRLVGDSIAAGYLDGVTNGKVSSAISSGTTEYCLGDYNDDCDSRDSANDDDLDAALLKMAQEFPKTDTAFSPYNEVEGVTITFPDDNTVRIRMYLLGSDKDYLENVCNGMNWEACPKDSEDSCCIDLKLNSRYNDKSSSSAETIP